MASPLRSALLIAIALPGALIAQHPDSAARLTELTVTVTRTPESLKQLGASVAVLDSSALRRGRVATGLDEALAFVPGLITGNRWNYSVDQRLVIRGYGARANFGVRGVKVILDGVPQTLPDGQSTLTNLDLGLVQRAEVLRGAASALYGNAAGGVLTFTTRVVPASPWMIEARGEDGSFGSSKAQVVAAGRTGAFGGTLSLSRFSTDGFRQHSSAEQRHLSLSTDWFASGNTTVKFRFAAADDPKAENPGALTQAELAIRRDSAAGANILRDADKRVSQSQGSIGVHHEGSGWQLDATTWGLVRSLDNPLATPPPAPAGPSSGTWVGIERQVVGGRAAATINLGSARLTTGLDIQTLRDDRENQRAIAGIPDGTLLLKQRERVTEVGPFAQVILPMTRRVTLRAGARRDATHFSVDDAFTLDGDASGAKTMASWSANVGASITLPSQITAWTSVATTFETPTTTELANRPAGDGGFNPDLEPQRSVSEEIGMRGSVRRLQFEVTAYRSTTRDAIVPWREEGGRTYFRNAGKSRTTGAEVSGTLQVQRRLALLATWTWTHAVFTDYAIRDGANFESFNGRVLAGLPEHVIRAGIRGSIGRSWFVDIDHAMTASLYADDRNSIRVPGWGAGVTGVRAAWHGTIGEQRVEPFVAVTNIFDRHYVGSVTLNGNGGRTLEPAAGRAIYVGLTLGVEGRD